LIPNVPVHPVLKSLCVAFFPFSREKTEVSTDFASVTRDLFLLLSEIRQILFETHEQISGWLHVENSTNKKDRLY
jgi:hypothetical protein